ncbi:MAG: FAD-linked oxidase C-terminal domain-containing protein [bacterium]|nr:FAD-linked oxidase C-terminal domain-containing protein [bacterium]
MKQRELLLSLQKIVGKKYATAEIEDRLCYAYDATGQRYLPDYVVKPANANEISEIMKLASKTRTPVYPRGAGSGLTGGSVPLKGGIALVLTRLNRILEIDRANHTVTVETGVLVSELQKAVESVGLFYPPDPASADFSTIGGNIAENAGGLRACRYGVTRDYVLQLEAVLPSGEIIHTGAKTVKSVTGYDLTRLLVGSEGTLAVITKAVLRLIAKVPARKTMYAVFPRITDAAEAVSDLVEYSLIPSTLELMDQKTVECIESYKPSGLPKNAGAILFIEADGQPEQIEKEIKQIVQLCERHNAITVKVAKNAEEREQLWNLRRAVSPAITRIAGKKINEDICVPRSELAPLFIALEKIAKKYRVPIVNYGHAGDGNIHVNVMVNPEDNQEIARGHKAVEDIFKVVLNLGGTLSGEHGIGNTKSRYLSWEVPPAELKLMREIKKLFDPYNILNPGKIFHY